MALLRDDNSEPLERAASALRRLATETEASKEERRVASEAMAERSAGLKVGEGNAKKRAIKRAADTSRRVRRKT